ncbi:MAG: hypothetical protein ISEC1_P0587 [Thiomicrorhabdus sp.]|nr:MAG: hypothetical protein ISEC1_P0587 [Thiomicrorhabdus sp.]
MFAKKIVLKSLFLVPLLLFSHLSIAASPTDPMKCKKELKGELKNICLKAHLNDPKAQHTMGRYYVGQMDQNIVDLPQAFYWHRRLSRLVDKMGFADPLYSETMYNTGIFYSEGLGIKQNYKKALYWFKKSAGRGESIAMLKLAMIYSNGHGVLADTKTSLYWLNKAVDAGELDAIVLLAQVYSEGKLLPRNDKKAFELLKLAATEKSSNALFSLANFYFHGIGTEANVTVAKSLFSESCRLKVLEGCMAYHDIDIQEQNKHKQPINDLAL